MEVVHRLEIGNWQRAGGPEGGYPEPWHIPGIGPERKPEPKALTAREIRELTNAQYQEV